MAVVSVTVYTLSTCKVYYLHLDGNLLRSILKIKSQLYFFPIYVTEIPVRVTYKFTLVHGFKGWFCQWSLVPGALAEHGNGEKCVAEELHFMVAERGKGGGSVTQRTFLQGLIP